MIRLMVVPLTFFFLGGGGGGEEDGFSTAGVGAILGNGRGIQEQNYFALLPGSEVTAGFHCKDWIIAI